MHCVSAVDAADDLKFSSLKVAHVKHQYQSLSIDTRSLVCLSADQQQTKTSETHQHSAANTKHSKTQLNHSSVLKISTVTTDRLQPS